MDDDTIKLARICRELSFEGLQELITRMEKGDNVYDFQNPGVALKQLKLYVDYASGKSKLPPMLPPYPGPKYPMPGGKPMGDPGTGIGVPEVAPRPRALPDPQPLPLAPDPRPPRTPFPGPLDPGPIGGVPIPVAPDPRPLPVPDPIGGPGLPVAPAPRKVPDRPADTPDLLITILINDP